MFDFDDELSLREQELLERLVPERLPAHVAIIMDGNGRWARQRSMVRLFGHESARTVVRTTVEGCRRLGISCLTLYAFSTENWSRPRAEVSGLMHLLETTIREEVPELHSNGIRILHIGEKDKLPPRVVDTLVMAEETTKLNEGMTLALAINYGGRRELLLAASRAAEACVRGELNPDELLDESVFSSFLQTAGLSDPDLMIRTADECRISNFLLWKLAYTELYFTDVLWPDFGREHLFEALVDYQSRDRRFGGV